MVRLKNKKEIAIMKEGGKKLREVVIQLLPQIKPGLTTKQIDEKADDLIRKEGGEPSFKKVKGYDWATCLPINEQVVHTPPNEKKIIKEGDLLTLDIGLFYKGFHVDYATTFVVGPVQNKSVEKFLSVGKEALTQAIRQLKVGNYLGSVSEAIEKIIYGNHYFVLKQLTGHGIGTELHEEPFIPGYLDQPIKKTLRIKQGLTVAVEVIYSMGSEEIMNEAKDNWSLITSDRSLSACFEHTVAVMGEKEEILT